MSEYDKEDFTETHVYSVATCSDCGYENGEDYVSCDECGNDIYSDSSIYCDSSNHLCYDCYEELEEKEEYTSDDFKELLKIKKK